MVFEKTKAMRNAERYLAQGKIKSAIAEYKHVINHDPKDFGTMNMLGDLYIKSSDKRAAIGCYKAVAEHYSKQGFAHKAIAIYNKILKAEPGSVEILEKLAELYKIKGSLMEARSHYTRVAEHHERLGRRMDALATWKEIALLDPNNTEVYLSIAESYVNENALTEAADAFAEAGLRFGKQGRHDDALRAFSKAFDLVPDDLKTLTGFVKTKCATGKAGEAAEKLSELSTRTPHSREIRFLLIDCYIEAGDIASAEKEVIRLVELEPANYPKFLDLTQLYIAAGDMDSATRILTMSSEHLLVGGQADEFRTFVNEILDNDPDHLQCLQLLVRHSSWQRDEAAFREALKRVVKVSNEREDVEAERYALLQLVMVLPQETAYADRLREINELYGYNDDEIQESLFDKQFLKNGNGLAAVDDAPGELDPAAVDFAVDEGDGEFADFAIVGETTNQNGNGHGSFGEIAYAEISADVVEDSAEESERSAADETRLQKEVESIKFYIESGYLELAGKAINELRGDFGDCEAILALEAHLKKFVAASAEESGETAFAEFAASVSGNGGKAFDINDLRSELGLEDAEEADDSDYETRYHTAVAYQEMGLTDEAIREFQEAVSLVTPNDGTRRFFACANLLGHCFMQKGMPQLALTWYHRTLETNDLTDEEKQGLWYELAGAYEAEGDMESAGRYFEQVYAENINFRDVSERVRNISVAH